MKNGTHAATALQGRATLHLVIPRDLRFSGPFVEMFFDRAQRSGGTCGFIFGTSQDAWANRLRTELRTDRFSRGGYSPVTMDNFAKVFDFAEEKTCI